MFDLDKVRARMLGSEAMPKRELKRVMISNQRIESFGFKLQRRLEYEHPLPQVGNNFYKNHSMISRAQIYRQHKGPLYVEAGRICIELTQKYAPLEDFCYHT